MRQRWFLLALVLAVLLPGIALGTGGDTTPDARFSANAKLSVTTSQSSASGRFTLDAALRSAAPKLSVSSDGRFGMQAAMTAPKSLLTGLCGADDLIFRNGFQNP